MANAPRPDDTPLGRRISRRAVLGSAAAASLGGLAAGVGIGYGVFRDGSSSATEAPAAAGGPVIGPVDQQKQRRLRTGLTAWDPSQTFDGFTLFTPLWQRTAYLLDMNGETVHTWDFPDEAPGVVTLYATILENGNLFVRLSKNPTQEQIEGEEGILAELDWDGNTLWRYADPDQHHDAHVLPNGNLLVLREEDVPPAVAAQVQGGIVAPEAPPLFSDWVVEVTKEGDVLWEWHAWEHLDPTVHVVNPKDFRHDWTHANSIEPLPDGNVLISFRNINTVAIIDRDTGDFAWELRGDPLAQQHDATILENGHVLLFNNAVDRANETPFDAAPHSDVLEIDPATDEVVWSYADPTQAFFFSPFISSAQRLANGNTFIAEGNYGRLFEVTSEGELIWEYISPHFVQNLLGDNNAIFRAYRYPAEEVPNAG